MPQTWTYEADLPGGMTHTIQVQSDSPAADFDLYVLDAAGNVVAQDTGPEAGAECSITTERDERFILRIELVSGHCGFSANISSRPADRSVARASRREPSGTRSSKNTRSRSRQPAGATQPTSSVPLRTSASALTTTEIQEMVSAHNEWRARYGCPPLEWSEELAAVAQDWADQLGQSMQMQHRSPNEFGENLYWCSGMAATPKAVVDAWGSEVEYYDEAQNNWWPKAGHWSQVVWADTRLVGAGVVRRGGQEIWVCNYDPRGNWTAGRPYPLGI